MKRAFILFAVIAVSMFLFSCQDQNTPEKDADDTMKETIAQIFDETESAPAETQNNKDGILTVDPKSFYKCVLFELPDGSFRDVAVDYMRKQASIKWVCAETFSVKAQFDYWSIGLEYLKGETYHGITYTNAKSSYDEFMMFYSDGKVTMKSGNPDEVVGNGCFSSIQNATQQFDPSVAGVTDVIMPSYKGFQAQIVGGYTVPENVKRTEDIKLANDVDTIYNAYSLLKKGDIIIQKDDTKGMSHARMLVEDPVIIKTGAGKINPSRSCVKTIEQTNAFDKTRKDGVKTTWFVDHVYSFADLYSTNYLPITLESYSKTKSDMEIPYLALDSEITSAILGKKVMSGSVKSNFPIRFVKVDILNSDGEIVISKLKNNMENTRTLPLRNHFTSVLTDIEAGNYTMVLTAGISISSAELARVDFSVK